MTIERDYLTQIPAKLASNLKISFFRLMLLGSVLWCSHCMAQDTDMGTWLGVNLSKDLTKKIGLELEEEVRIFKNFGEIDRFASEFAAFYKLNSNLKGGAGYGWIYDHDVNDSFWENRHRIYAYVRGRFKTGRFTVSLREKYQSTFYDKTVKGFDYSPQRYLRSRLGVEYDIPNNKAAPYVATEMHYQLNNPDGNEIDDWRYTAGIEFPLSKNTDIDTFFRFKQEVNVKKPDRVWLIGVTLNWDL